MTMKYDKSMESSRYIFSHFLLMMMSISIAQAEPVEITEWQVPWENTRPRDPYLDQNGRVWFCGQGGEYLAYLDPLSGEFKKYDLGHGAGPHNLIVDEDGFVWFAGNLNGYIGKLDPNTGDIQRFSMPDPEAGDPHTLIFNSAGNIWFTVQGGNFIGKLIKKTGEIKLVKVQTEDARPYGIAVDANDRPWVVLFGSFKLATVDPTSMVLGEIELPRKDARPRRLVITTDNSIWYVDYAEGFLGRYDQNTGNFKEWSLPGGKRARPYGMAVDDNDNLWFVETGLYPNRFVGFNTISKEFFSITDIPSGGESVRHMYFHQPTNEIWFGEDTNYIARARIR